MESGLAYLVPGPLVAGVPAPDPVAWAAVAALLLAVALWRPWDREEPPWDTTARQDLWLARHRLGHARALLDAAATDGHAAGGPAGHPNAGHPNAGHPNAGRPDAADAAARVERHLIEALRQIRGARAKPGWNDLPAALTAALDRALPDVEQAVAILRHHHGDGDTRRRLGVVVDALHGALERVTGGD